MEITPSLVGILGFVALFVLIFLRLPIAFAFALVGFLGLLYLSDFKAATVCLASTVWTYATSYILMAIPLFMLMGQFANHSGIGSDLYDSALKWFGRLPGGLAISTTWGTAGFGACTGSTTTGILTFGPIAYRPMIDKGYDKRLALGTICCGATMGSMIPPSIGFVVYGSITEESVGQLFMGGVFPGILEAVLYSIAILLLAGLGIWAGPPGGSSTWKERLISLRGIWGMLLLLVLVLGGIYAGIVTPTEASAIGAFGSLVILLARKGFRLAPVRLALKECLLTTCMVYTLVICSLVFARFIALTGLNTFLCGEIASWDVPNLYVIGAALLMFLVLGCVMPALPMVVLTVPFLYPIFVVTLGYSGIWFGVIVVLMMELAFVTPPIGVNLFVTKSLFGDEAPLGDIFRGVFPFILCDLVRLVLLVAFPQIALWLPRKMYATRSLGRG